MLITISIILVALCLIIILTVIIRKFPALAVLNVGNIPGEKESKFKEQILKARVERDLSRWSGFFGRIWLFLSRHLGSSLKSYQTRLKKVKVNYKAEVKTPWVLKQKKIKKLALAAEEFLQKDDSLAAEEKLVEIISLDQKNLEAFSRLGDLYADQKKWPEARQTYAYALKLTRQPEAAAAANDITPQKIHFSISNMEKEAGDPEAALENIREALELEPNNPRYLDLILDLSIIKKDKNLAMEYWGKLAAVNPENNKLAEWREEIEKL